MARDAKSTLPAIQYYFTNKDGLFRAVVEEIGEYLEQRLGPLGNQIRKERNQLDDQRALHLLEQFADHFAQTVIADKKGSERSAFLARAGIERADALVALSETIRKLAIEPCAILVARLIGADATSKETLLQTLTFIGQITVFCHGPARHVFGISRRGAVDLAMVKVTLRDHLHAMFGRRVPKNPESVYATRGAAERPIAHARTALRRRLGELPTPRIP